MPANAWEQGEGLTAKDAKFEQGGFSAHLAECYENVLIMRLAIRLPNLRVGQAHLAKSENNSQSLNNLLQIVLRALRP